LAHLDLAEPAIVLTLCADGGGTRLLFGAFIQHQYGVSLKGGHWFR
jgi:hypothetical protein